jgi:hypothetical protein
MGKTDSVKPKGSLAGALLCLRRWAGTISPCLPWQCAYPVSSWLNPYLDPPLACACLEPLPLGSSIFPFL